MSLKPKISIIMPVFNGKNFIVKSLPPLVAMKQRGEILEVIVVDDSSTDDTVEISKGIGARVISSGGRLGPGAARNEAAKLAEGDVLWFVDADVVVHDDAVQYLIEGFKSSEVVAVFGSYDDKPTAQNFLSQYKNMVHHFYHNQGRSEASTFWSGCGAVRKQAFLDVEGFDIETYKRPSIEDIELGYRLRASGGKIMLYPDLKSTHLKEWRIMNLLHTEIFCRAIPWSKLMLTQTGIVDDLNVSSGERVRAGIAGLLFLLFLAVFVGLFPWWSLIIGICVVVISNWRLCHFFMSRKSPIFALRSLAFHQIYYLYSGVAFAYSWVVVKLGRRQK